MTVLVRTFANFTHRFDLGVAFRMRYGELLKGFNDNLPVFRTTSEGKHALCR